jgi:hypothetical protein
VWTVRPEQLLTRRPRRFGSRARATWLGVSHVWDGCGFILDVAGASSWSGRRALVNLMEYPGDYHSCPGERWDQQYAHAVAETSDARPGRMGSH